MKRKKFSEKHHRFLQAEFKLIVGSSTKMSMEEAKETRKVRQKRLYGHLFSNSAKLLCEERPLKSVVVNAIMAIDGVY